MELLLYNVNLTDDNGASRPFLNGIVLWIKILWLARKGKVTKMIDWFALGFGLLGLLHILSGCYGWNWWWRLARGLYLPDLVGRRMTRLMYIGFGYGMLAIGITLFLQKLLQGTSLIYWMVGFGAAGLITALIYNTRGYFDLLIEYDDKDEKV